MYIFITEDEPESKNAKGINKNVADDKLKYGDYKKFLFCRSYLRHGMNRIQSKDHIELTYLHCLLTTIKNIYLKIDIAGYHIFMNLLVNHITIILPSIGNSQLNSKRLFLETENKKPKAKSYCRVNKEKLQ